MQDRWYIATRITCWCISSYIKQAHPNLANTFRFHFNLQVCGVYEPIHHRRDYFDASICLSRFYDSAMQYAGYTRPNYCLTFLRWILESNMLDTQDWTTDWLSCTESSKLLRSELWSHHRILPSSSGIRHIPRQWTPSPLDCPPP